MNKRVIVIYASKYGTTRQYATWIAEALDAELADAKAVKPEKLRAYDVIVYGGGLYAGGIAGVKPVAQNPCKNLVVFTVGLANPDSTNYSAIIKKNFTPEQIARMRVFHLRGGIDYERLGILHKFMMAVMKRVVQRKPETERDLEDKAFLATYGAAVNFTDRKTCDPIVSYVKNLMEAAKQPPTARE